MPLYSAEGTGESWIQVLGQPAMLGAPVFLVGWEAAGWTAVWLPAKDISVSLFLLPLSFIKWRNKNNIPQAMNDWLDTLKENTVQSVKKLPYWPWKKVSWWENSLFHNSSFFFIDTVSHNCSGWLQVHSSSLTSPGQWAGDTTTCSLLASLPR